MVVCHFVVLISQLYGRKEEDSNTKQDNLPEPTDIIN
jgi:hypothetical protein